MVDRHSCVATLAAIKKLDDITTLKELKYKAAVLQFTGELDQRT